MVNFVPAALRNHPQYPKVLHAIRVLQFIFAIVNIGLFANYIVRTSVRLSSSSGAVVGILAAAVAFSVIATAINCTKLGTYNRTTVMIFVIDVCFVAAYIAVAIITSMDRHRPAGIGKGSCFRGGDRNDDDVDGDDGDDDDDGNNTGSALTGCNLTSASLVLAVVSTLVKTLEQWEMIADPLLAYCIVFLRFCSRASRPVTVASSSTRCDHE